MSKFYDLNSSESDSSESEEEQIVTTKRQLNFSSDSEDEKRVVKSNKEKKYDEFQKIFKDLKQHKNIKDLTKVLTDFDLLVKSYEKTKKSVESDCINKFYIRVISELEDYVENAWKNKKDISKINAKSLATLRQKLKKYNKDFEAQISDFRQNPSQYPTELTDDVEEGSNKVRSKEEKNDDEDDEEEDEWDETSSESSSDDNVEYQNPADRFLKANTNKQSDSKKKEKKESKETRKKAAKIEDDNDVSWTVVENNKHRVFASDEEITFENVLKKMNEDLESRFTRKDTRRGQSDVMEQLYAIVTDKHLGLGLQMKIKLVMLTSLLQYKCNSGNPAMQFEQWTKALKLYSDMLCLLEDNMGTATFTLGGIDDQESLQVAPFVINGCLIGLLQQIDEEYTKVLVNHDFNDYESMTYADKFQYEKEVIVLCDRISKYCDAMNYPTEKKYTVSMLQMNHLYYRVDASIIATNGCKDYQNKTSYTVMKTLCRDLVNNDDRYRSRALLCHVYFLALHDHWQDAINLFVMSDLTKDIDRTDVATKVLFNRVTVQLGLCAFKNGLIREAHDALADIISTGRLKELLAQSVRNVDRRVEGALSAEEMYREKLRLIAYHSHINTDVVEAVYLISAMLLYVQQTIDSGNRRNIISKNLHHVLKQSERLTLVGPPDSVKDHVVAACKAMFIGDWRATEAFVFSAKMETTIWRMFGAKYSALRTEIGEKIKIESLKIFILTNADYYLSLSCESLCDMYELSTVTVGSVVSRLILTKRLNALLDEPSKCVVMNQMKTSALQGAALKLAEKVAVLADLNEKLRDPTKVVPKQWNTTST